MARGYVSEEIRTRIIGVLEDSDMGMSGVAIAGKLGINRSTMTKYLKVFAAEGLLRQNNIGNIILWSLESGQESYDFPADYFRIAPQFLDLLLKYCQDDVYALIRNCIHSGAFVEKLVSEVIVPAIYFVEDLFDKGKIGSSEQRFIQNIMANSLHLLNQYTADTNPKKYAIVISADLQNVLLAEAAASVLRSNGWTVFHMGDMSSSIDVIFDIDFQKFLGKIPRQKSGITAVLVFSGTEQGLNFFSDSVCTIRQKSRKPLKLVLCGKVKRKTKIESDYTSAVFDDIINWSKTSFANTDQ